MIKTYDTYIKEQFGAITIQRKSLNQLVEPDSKQLSPLTIYPSGARGFPNHWSNSTFVSGDRQTSAFGMNPSSNKKKSKRSKILSYFDFMEVSKKVKN